jgi:hypothetical protein
MPSPRKGSPVTGDVAPDTGVTDVVGDRTMNAASLSMVIDAMPAESMELVSGTNADPVHAPTSLDAVIFGELTSTVIGMANVP